MDAWLKALGTHDARIPEDGLASIEWVTHDIGFPVEPNVRAGDRLVLYASGFGKIFGVVEVHMRAELDNRQAPWSYRVPVRARLVIDSLERAPALESANDGRELRRSIRQQSHIRLKDVEYENAVRSLEEALSLEEGDLRSPSISGRI